MKTKEEKKKKTSGSNKVGRPSKSSTTARKNTTRKVGRPKKTNTSRKKTTTKTTKVFSSKQDQAKQNATPYLRIENITPEKAQKLLKKNTINRALSKHYVANYTHQMVLGLWRLGEPIYIDLHGNLINGQHRLNAVVKSGKTIQFLVVYNMPTDAFQWLDEGKKRSGADVLSIVRDKGLNGVLANGLNVARKLNLGRKDFKAGKREGGLSNQQVVQLYEKKPQYYDNTLEKIKLWNKEMYNGVNKTNLAGFYWFLEPKFGGKVDEFMDMLCIEAIKRPQLINHFRRRVIENIKEKTENRTSQNDLLFEMLWVFKYFINDKANQQKKIYMSKKVDLPQFDVNVA